MDKITLKITKYFMFIITMIVAISFIASSVFLSSFYFRIQYDNLKSSANHIYDSLLVDDFIPDKARPAILINENGVTPLIQHHMDMMSMMPFIHSFNPNDLKAKGVLESGMGNEFLYYRLQTDIGDIVVFQDNEYSSDYLKIVYIVLFFIFLSGILLAIPLISYLGKKITRPILKLQNNASAISKGNFDIDFNIKTDDEIEDLSNSLNNMAVELKKKYQLQRDFIANVSHDFKTPLSVIRSYSEAVNDGLIEERQIKRYSKDIIKEVDRLNSLVMDLLQLSKLQDKAYSLSREYIDLRDLVDDTVNAFMPITKEKNISFNISIDPIEIYADPKYIQRVIFNFVDNAIKYSNEDGQIDINTYFIGDSVKLSVRDYGIGIEVELLDDIWDKYYKNEKSGGMGLGLPICKEILKLHNFQYGANSKDIRGSEFYFIIPEDNFEKSS